MHIETRHGIRRNICAFICAEANNHIKKVLVTLLCIGISACGGGGSSDGNVTTQQIQLTGSVGDGPITGANISVTDNDGNVIATTVSNATASYSISIPEDTLFPVTITATGGTDTVTGSAPDFKMISTALDKQNQANDPITANINPFSTFMVKMSRTMSGGMSRSNLDSAKQILLQKFSFGLDANQIPDPITSRITASNVAGIVKSSEAMGEMIRRTRDTLITSGTQINADAVIEALSGDIADGKIDGIGTNSNAKLTATAKLASAQVLIEVLGNRLKVNNLDATVAMNNSIKLIEPDTSMTTANVMITTDLIYQARESITVAKRYNTTSELNGIDNILASLSGGIYPDDVNSILPADAADSLTSAINSIANASNDDLDKINKGDNSATPVATAPVITTVANTTGQVGLNYHYDINATDANSDDILNYSLVTAPAGMTINSANGAINWTPSTTQTGTHNVGVRVSDNSSSSLSVDQNFSIQVIPAPIVNVEPVISTAAVTSVQVGSDYRYDVDANDSNAGDVLKFSLTTAPTGMNIDASNGIISWSPTSAQTGSHSVAVRVTDDASPALSATQSFIIQVAPAPVVNVAPVITSVAKTTAQVGTAYSYDVNASDNNTSDTLTYALTASPTGMSINASTGFIAWNPSDSQVHTHSVTVQVSDSASPALSASQSFSIQVSAAPVVNVRPVVTSTALTAAQVSKAYRYDVNATDDNSNDVLSYSLVSAPAGMSINATSGIITWTPADTQTGDNAVSVRVSDNAEPPMSVSQNFTINVSAADVEIIRVNAGGGQYTDAQGKIWSADYGYTLGSTSVRTDTISGTVDDTLYQTERWHSEWSDTTAPELEYRFKLPSSDYVVKLHFAEVSKTVSRIFDVKIEGNLELDDLNILEVAGRYTALIKSFNTTVSDGELNISFPRNTRSPQISAIEIIPVATQTSVTTENDTPVTVQVPEATANTGTLTVISGPSNGDVTVSGGSMTYTSNSGYAGNETIVYRFVDGDGNTTISSINITVTCSTCNQESVVTLSWQPNTGTISGYKIYYGPDSANANELKTDIALSSGQIDSSAPQISYAVTTDLNFYPGEQICFRIQAYKDGIESALSDPVCGTI